MGIFTRKKKISIQSTATRMLDDKDFVYAHKEAMSQWLWSDKELGVDLEAPSISDYIIEVSQNRMPKRFDRLYRWTAKPNKSIFGLPVSTLAVDAEEQYIQAGIEYLTQQISNPIEVIHADVADRDYYYVCWLKLVNDYGYDSQTNELTKLSKQVGYPCYLKDGYLLLSQASLQEDDELEFQNQTLSFSMGRYFDRPLNWEAEQTAYVPSDTDGFVFTYGYEKYTLPSETPQTDETDNQSYVEPILELIEESITLDLSYLNPVLTEGSIIPADNDWLSISYQVLDKIYWFEYEIGSGIDKIDTALQGNNLIGQYYPRAYVRLNEKDCYNHNDVTIKKCTSQVFKKIGMDAKQVNQGLKQSVGASNWGDVRGMYLFMGLRIAEAHTDTAMAEYAFRYFKRLYDVAGETSLSQIIQDNYTSQTLRYDKLSHTTHTGVYENLAKGMATVKYSTIDTVKRKRKYVFLKRKIIIRQPKYEIIFQTSENSYEVMTVLGLSQTVTMSGYSATHGGNDVHLVIPIDRLLVKDLSPKERDKLLYKALHVQIMFVKITRQKWYETLGFKLVLAAIVIAVSIAFAPAGMSLGAMVKTALIAAAKALAISYATQALIQYALKQGWIDPKTAGILSVVATVVSIAYGAGWDMSKVLTAPNIMRTINSSFDAYNKYLQYQIMDVQKQMNALGMLNQARQEQLNQVQKLLDTKVFDPSHEMLKSSFTPSVDLFQSVEMFYSKHTNFNVVGLSHGLVNHFVEGSLTPKPTLMSITDIEQEIYDVLLIT